MFWEIFQIETKDWHGGRITVLTQYLLTNYIDGQVHLGIFYKTTSMNFYVEIEMTQERFYFRFPSTQGMYWRLKCIAIFLFFVSPPKCKHVALFKQKGRVFFCWWWCFWFIFYVTWISQMSKKKKIKIF